MRECKLVQDLWPLYIDGEISDDSKQFIEEHINKCSSCKELQKEKFDLGINEFRLIKDDPIPLGSSEKFILKIKRRLQMTITGIIISGIIITSGVWYYSQWRANQVVEQQEHDKWQFYKEQLLALEELSPPSQQLLSKLGIRQKVNTSLQKDRRILIKYAMYWNPKSHIKWIREDGTLYTSNLSFRDKIKENTYIEIVGSGSSSSNERIEGSITTSPVNKGIKQVKVKRQPFYVFIEAPNFNYKFNYKGRNKNILINKKLTYQGVDFIIESLNIDNSEFKINYRQLTPANKVGVYQLDFSLDDRLGNLWGSEYDVNLNVINPKQFSIKGIHSLSKNWILKLNHIIQVIPGNDTTVNLEGEG